MNKLIFHKTSKLNSVSPFDEAIVKLVKDKDIKIACPYINIYYLQNILRSAKSWILLTDINEWVGSTRRKIEVQEIEKFINANKDKIKHCEDLHAKTIITNDRALLGSANFTDKGIFKRNEVSVILSNEEEVLELNNWFNDWFEHSDFIDLPKLTAANKKRTFQSIPNNSEKIQKSAYKIRTTNFQNESDKEGNKENLVTKSEIESYLNKWKNNEWEYQFFKLINKAINIIGYENGSDYLSITMTKTKGISVQLNNRYILKSHSYNKSNAVSLILPLSFDDKEQKEKYKNIILGMEYFTKNKVPQKVWAKFNISNPSNLSNEILMLWELAILEEKERKYLSPYRRYHQPYLYNLAVDEMELSNFFENL